MPQYIISPKFQQDPAEIAQNEPMTEQQQEQQEQQQQQQRDPLLDLRLAVAAGKKSRRAGKTLV